MLCTINRNSQSGDTLDLNQVVNGQFQSPTSQPFSLQTQTVYRMRLTQRGTVYTCEAMASDQPGTTVTTTVGSAPTGPQLMALRANSMEAHFYSVVAESVLP
jgi:hypothetical protein